MEHLFITENQKKSTRRLIEQKMKYNDITAMVIGIAGLSLAFHELELFYGELDWSTSEDGSFEYTVVEEQHVERGWNTALRVIVGMSSIVLSILVYNHYRLKLKLYKAKQKADSFDTLRSSKMLYFILGEVSYCMIHTPPGFNWVFEFEQHGGSVRYSYDALVCIVMLGRIYLIWRVLTSYSSWNDERAEDICNNCLCEGGVNFAIKAELKERPYTVVSLVLLVSILAFGLALRTAERPFMHTSEMDWDYLWNGMWCIIITMTTVGFGDFYPSTHLGRLIGVFACFWGTFLVSLMVVSLTISSEFTPQQRKAFDKYKKDEDEYKLKVNAANAIKAAIRLRLFLKRNSKANQRRKAMHINKFKRALIEYRTHKRNILASEQDAPVEYILAKLNDKVSFGLEKIKKDCFIYRTLLARLDTAENNQSLLMGDIETLDTLNKNIKDRLDVIRMHILAEPKSARVQKSNFD